MDITNLNIAIDKARSRRTGESRAVHLLPSNPIAPYVRTGMGGAAACMNWDCRPVGLLPAVIGSLFFHSREQNIPNMGKWGGIRTLDEQAMTYGLSQETPSLYAEHVLGFSALRPALKQSLTDLSNYCKSVQVVIAAPEWCYGTNLTNALEVLKDTPFIPIVVVNTTILLHQLETTIKASMGGMDIPESREEAARIIEQHLPFELFVNGPTP